MSTATLNVWITDFGDACHIEDSEKWFVHITDCTGNVLKWCGTISTNLDCIWEMSVKPN